MLLVVSPVFGGEISPKPRTTKTENSDRVTSPLDQIHFLVSLLSFYFDIE
ncbi:hypothetical protein KHA80_11970 [Anaerobacillus sp. HL2]|nr:hypothetical protein KHA80_11970 [Anaerobacillus sp. HL2]